LINQKTTAADVLVCPWSIIDINEKKKKYCTFGHKMHLYSVGLSRWTISLVRVPPEQQARDKNKAKGRIYDRFLKCMGTRKIEI
jgi:hypothetical protein